jgi:hypothetical protein
LYALGEQSSADTAQNRERRQRFGDPPQSHPVDGCLLGRRSNRLMKKATCHADPACRRGICRFLLKRTKAIPRFALRRKPSNGSVISRSVTGTFGPPIAMKASLPVIPKRSEESVFSVPDRQKQILRRSPRDLLRMTRVVATYDGA